MVGFVLLGACQSNKPENQTESFVKDSIEQKPKSISEPLVTHIYTADPSAHVFDGKIYIYPSHDIESGVAQDDLGSHFDMKDYHILSMDSVTGETKDNGVALDIKDIPWVGRQLQLSRMASIICISQPKISRMFLKLVLQQVHHLLALSKQRLNQSKEVIVSILLSLQIPMEVHICTLVESGVDNFSDGQLASMTPMVQKQICKKMKSHQSAHEWLN